MAAFSREDFRRIRWSLVSMVFFVLLGAGTVAAALYAEKMAQVESRRVEADRNDIRGRLARARDEEKEIRAKIARYQDIVARGYITPEQRLDWIERIAQIRTARKLIDVQYELAPQQPIEAALLPEGALGGGYEFLSSSMKLEMQLLHEDDLLGFLADLRSSVRALLVVRGCDVERLATPGRGEGGTRAQLKASCELDWITLREKKA
jgi:hypothetical protein